MNNYLRQKDLSKLIIYNDEQIIFSEHGRDSYDIQWGISQLTGSEYHKKILRIHIRPETSIYRFRV